MDCVVTTRVSCVWTYVDCGDWCGLWRVRASVAVRAATLCTVDSRGPDRTVVCARTPELCDTSCLVAVVEHITDSSTIPFSRLHFHLSGGAVHFQLINTVFVISLLCVVPRVNWHVHHSA